MDEQTTRLLKNLSSLHLNIAKDAYPQGGTLRCQTCGLEISFTTEDAAKYLAHGWPQHCGKTMLSSPAVDDGFWTEGEQT